MTHRSRALPRSRPMHPPPRGNALIYALLALIIVGVTIAGYLSGRQAEIKTQTGQAEATVLDVLRNGANNAISANILPITQGLGLNVNGVPIGAVLDAAGEFTWEFNTDQLRQMGYLPSGWTTPASSLNDRPYVVRIRRTPAGCIPALNCDVEGLVFIDGPIRGDSPTQIDGAVIGPILTKLGADGAVTLPPGPGTNPAVLLGYQGAWSEPNPVAGAPAGVVAVRIGTKSSAWSSFVRIGDIRDPNLAGNLTAAGNLAIGGTTRLNGAVTANAPVRVAGSPVTVANTAGDDCTTIAPTGVITVNCTGAVNSITGAFSSSINTPQVETNLIMVNAGDFLVRGPTGILAQVSAAGDVTATGNISGQQLQLTNPVVEFSPCTPGAVASLVGGGIAVCSPLGQFVGAIRYGTNKGVCAGEGGQAIDPNTREGLLCKNGRWAPAVAQNSDFVFMGSFLVGNTTLLAMPACRDMGVAPPVPLLYLMPANEIASMAMNRSATQQGNRVNNGSGYFVGGGG